MTDTTPIAITGHSDDLLVIDHNGTSHEIDAYNGCQLTLTDPHTDDTILIDARYTEHDVWAIAATMPSEAHQLPDWDIHLDTGHDYSPTLIIHAPAGTYWEEIPNM